MKPDSRRAAGTLLMTWLTATEQRSSLPVISCWNRLLIQGICFMFPMKMKKARKGDQKRVIDL